MLTKALKYSILANSKYNVGNLVNIMQVDLMRIQMMSMILPSLIITPF